MTGRRYVSTLFQLNPNTDNCAGPAEGADRRLLSQSESPAVYDVGFWMCYAANLCLTIAFAMLFRYADFVSYVGGNEMHLGLVVGVGMVGALAMRAVQGVGIDRYGPRLVWLLSLVGFTASVLLHLLVTRVDGVGIYVARILLTTSTAGAFGASITYISLRVPPTRIAEMIGTLGTSGFIGIALGPTLADLAFSGPGGAEQHVHRMFLWAAAMSSVSFVLTLVATRKPVRVELRRRPSLWGVLRKYHPGVMLLVSAGTGMTLGLPHTFVRAYAAELDFSGIRTFFLVYASVALVVRVATRRLPDRIGVRPVILWGLASAAVSMLSYLCVRGEWSLAIPALLAGTAHALLFPAVMAGGSVTFPVRYRGIATTLMLAMFDVGSLIGQPVVGAIIRGAKRIHLPGYATMFVIISILLWALAGFYCWKSSAQARSS
jgi:MFS family permease